MIMNLEFTIRKQLLEAASQPLPPPRSFDAAAYSCLERNRHQGRTVSTMSMTRMMATGGDSCDDAYDGDDDNSDDANAVDAK